MSDDSVMNTLSPESERRINNVINLGIVTDVNHDDSSCRVRIDSNETDWLPFGAARMGNVKIWNPPSVGEQVMVVSENGELDTAIVTCSFDYDSHPMPSANANSIEMHCKDGAVFSYDHSTHKLDVRLPNGSTTHVQSNVINVSGDNITFNATNFRVACDSYAIDCSNYTLNSSSNNHNGTMVINGMPYLDHTHNGVKSGPASTGGVNG